MKRNIREEIGYSGLIFLVALSKYLSVNCKPFFLEFSQNVQDVINIGYTEKNGCSNMGQQSYMFNCSI